MRFNAASAVRITSALGWVCRLTAHHPGLRTYRLARCMECLERFVAAFFPAAKYSATRSRHVDVDSSASLSGLSDPIPLRPSGTIRASSTDRSIDVHSVAAICVGLAIADVAARLWDTVPPARVELGNGDRRSRGSRLTLGDLADWARLPVGRATYRRGRSDTWRSLVGLSPRHSPS